MHKQSRGQKKATPETPIHNNTRPKQKKVIKKMTKRAPVHTTSTRSFVTNSAEFDSPKMVNPGESVPADGNYPGEPSRRKSLRWSMRNPHKDDEMVEEDKETIEKFLEPIGLGQYKEKFTSFDQVLMTKTGVLKAEFGMSTKERKMLRKHANYYRTALYYKTGEIYQPKYQWREPIPAGRHHYDRTSEDEVTFTLPAKDGLYRAYLRYPGSSYRENHRAGTYNDARFFINQSKNAVLTPEQQEEAVQFFQEAEDWVPRWATHRGNAAQAPTTDSEMHSEFFV